MTIEKNNLEIPNSLANLKFFQEALENGLRDAKIDIKSIDFTMGSAGGDNFCSQIFRVNAKFIRKNQSKIEEISVIIKSMPVVEQTVFLDELEVFLKEKIIYFDILPRLEILLDNVKFGPKCYYSLKEPIYTIVFEDLKALGYEMANRDLGLDFEHASVVMNKLGKFHAATMLLVKKDPNIVKHFKNGLFNPNVMRTNSTMQSIFGGNIDTLISVVSKWPNYESITRKLRKVQIDYCDRVERISKPRKGELLVLNHGDLWVNNFLFKYDKDRRVVDLVFVDFQMSYYNSPGVDLNYFFNTSLTFEVLTTQRDDLLQVYHKSLCNTLQELHSNIPLPTIEDIRNEYHAKEVYGFVALFAIYPMIAIDKEYSDDTSIESLVDKDVGKIKRELLFNSPRSQKLFKYSLKRFDNLGVFD